MAFTSGFFNSVRGDRTYTAEQISNMFEGLITEGIFQRVGDGLLVQPNSGMTIQINTGRGWFANRWVNNDSEYLLTLENSDVVLNRYCAVCIRVDLSDSGRTAQPYLKYSEFATKPVKPTMERTETIKEYCLAYIYVNAGATAITYNDFEDTRFDDSLCGWVTAIINNCSTTMLYNYWQNIFTEWFNGLKNYLDENAETKIVADIQQLYEDIDALYNQAYSVQATFDGLGWSSNTDGSYTQSITVDGVTANNTIMVLPAAEYEDTYIAMECEPVSQSQNTITFKCLNLQNVNMTVNVYFINL